ncbi:MAG: peptidoglycan DD-metalloendopeptidase family protein [Nitrospirae bacterium]|nr:peptidoglycan DD-metalloendopeptidase family protein [Candidatus Troglogloeales bacterium]
MIHQGEVVLFALPIESGMQSAVGQFQDQAIPFFEDGQRLSALLGADLALAPGKYPLAINKKEYIVEVLPTDFGVETLTLPKDKVDLSPATAERVAKEAAQFQDVFGQRRPSLAGGDKRLWSDLFLVPVEGPTSGTFGKKRVINGQEKNPHTGEDIRAPLGASVAASNSGKIVLSGDFFFNGLSLVIDHGGGLFTMYFHLSEMKVKAGDLVKRGQVIGLVGQSGRATGPHLHWGARLNGARVDPFSLVKAVKGVILANGRP